MLLAESIDQLRAWRRAQTGRVGVVPTMGALHAGHVALVDAARREHDSVIVTIFVNPTQFAPGEDFAAYPRDLPGDLALLERAGVDLVFAPPSTAMYPPGFQTAIIIERVTAGLEGERRPGHFRGAATVVAKVFNLTQPTAAYFGQKDAQQVVVIRRMARDLDFPVEIVVLPTVRDADGLALSSRNRYLTPDQRAAAPELQRGLRAAAAAYEAGERAPVRLIETVRSEIVGGEVDYIALNHAGDLSLISVPVDAPLLLSLAVRYGGVRLLDNTLLPTAINTRAGLSTYLGAPDP